MKPQNQKNRQTNKQIKEPTTSPKKHPKTNIKKSHKTQTNPHFCPGHFVLIQNMDGFSFLYLIWATWLSMLTSAAAKH